MTTNFRLLCAAAALLAAAGYFFWQTGRTDAARLAADGRMAALTSRAQNLERDIARRRQGEAALSSQPKPPPSRPAKAAPKRPALNLAEELQHNPAVIARFQAAKRSEFAAAYGPFLKQLNLDPARLEKWEKAYVDREEQLVDLQASAQDQSLSPSDPGFQGLRQQADDALAAAEQEALGDAYGSLVQYNRSLPVRTLVGQIAGVVAFTSPLTAEQGEQLNQAMANASSSYQAGDKADWSQVDWRQVDQAARQFLTPQQLAAWEQAEPMGGGPSRWMAVLSGRLTAAEKADAGVAAKPAAP